jgi:hypothetical protein
MGSGEVLMKNTLSDDLSSTDRGAESLSVGIRPAGIGLRDIQTMLVVVQNHDLRDLLTEQLSSVYRQRGGPRSPRAPYT